jgi:hypothetical protein
VQFYLLDRETGVEQGVSGEKFCPTMTLRVVGVSGSRWQKGLRNQHESNFCQFKDKELAGDFSRNVEKQQNVFISPPPDGPLIVYFSFELVFFHVKLRSLIFRDNKKVKVAKKSQLSTAVVWLFVEVMNVFGLSEDPFWLFGCFFFGLLSVLSFLTDFGAFFRKSVTRLLSPSHALHEEQDEEVEFAGSFSDADDLVDVSLLFCS